MTFELGEVWFARFPYEDDATKSSLRPVIVLNNDEIGVLSTKVTKHAPRENDPYDISIVYWDEAGLRLDSTARVSKTVIIAESQFKFKIGKLVDSDLKNVVDKYIEYINSK